MKDHDSGARDQAEEGGVAGASGRNVVPFPRTWYGAVDELVPIRSDDPPRGSVPGVDALAFWGGEPGGAPADTATEPEAEPVTPDSAQPQPRPEPEPAPDERVAGLARASLRVGTETDRARPRAPYVAGLTGAERGRSRRAPALLALGVCVALLLAVAAAFGPGVDGGHPSDRHTGRVRGGGAHATALGAARRLTATATTRRPKAYRASRRHQMRHHAAESTTSEPRAKRSTPSPATRPSADTTPVVSAVPTTGESAPTSGSASTGSGRASTGAGGGGATPAGALPDVQQTNQQP